MLDVCVCVCVCVLMLVGHVPDGVEDPVHLGGPAAVVGVVHLLGEVLQRLLLALLQRQRLAQVRNVVEALQLGHAASQEQREQVDEEAGVLTDGQVGLVAHLLEPARGEGGGELKFYNNNWAKWMSSITFYPLFY